MDDALKSFIEFVQCANKLNQIEHQLNFTQKELNKIQQEIQNAQNLVNESKNKMDESMAQVKSFEFDGRELRQKIDETKKRLEETSRPKEYEAYQKQIEELEILHDQNEDKLINSWELYEVDKAEYEKQEKIFQEWYSEKAKELEEKKATKKTLESQIKDIEPACKELENKVKSDMLTRYNQMKKSVPDPVVPAKDIFCTACNFQISQKDLSGLRRSLLVPCKNCYRLLYIDKDQE